MTADKNLFPLSNEEEGFVSFDGKLSEQVPSENLSSGDLSHMPFCKGTMKVIKITENLMVIHCKNCGLRIRIRTTMPKTAGELKKYLETDFKFSQNTSDK